MGVLTLYGLRGGNFKLDDEWREPAIEQQPGHMYLGTMASVQHYVQHYKEPGPLYTTSDYDTGMKIVILFRTDCFSHCRARNMVAKPCPQDVFDAVNAVIAEKLSKEPLVLPTSVDAMAECEDACQRGLFAANDILVPSSAKRLRYDCKR